MKRTLLITIFLLLFFAFSFPLSNLDFLKEKGESFTAYAESVITGAGTSDYIPKWEDSTTLDDSVIRQSGDNIGLGVDPSESLHISGKARVTEEPSHSMDAATKGYVDALAEEQAAGGTPADWDCEQVSGAVDYYSQAQCSSGYRLITGGCALIPESERNLSGLWADGPSGQGWTCGHEDTGASLQAFAQCCR